MIVILTESSGDSSISTFCTVVVNQTCHENVNQFLCIHDSRCIDEIFVCDGDQDCSNGADERYDLCKSSSMTELFVLAFLVHVCNTRLSVYGMCSKISLDLACS